MANEYPFDPLEFERLNEAEMRHRARANLEELRRRRTVRHFSPEPVPRAVIEDCLLAAGSAPNGANKQPWHFVVVSDPEIKAEIREAAEVEEREFYERRASPRWLADLAPLGTDAVKPFLVEAPCLIAIFAQLHGVDEAGEKIQHYYVNESVGIATGFLIASLHHAGLATLTHTPSPMGFLNQILDRPKHERAFLVLVVGYPAPEADVPRITKKGLTEIATFL